MNILYFIFVVVGGVIVPAILGALAFELVINTVSLYKFIKLITENILLNRNSSNVIAYTFNIEKRRILKKIKALEKSYPNYEFIVNVHKSSKLIGLYYNSKSVPKHRKKDTSSIPEYDTVV